MSDVLESPAKPKEISAQRKAYAFERSMGFSQREACRRAHGDPDNGTATKWERNKQVQEWIAYFRRTNLTDDMLIEKRIRIEEALNSILHGDGGEFPHVGDAPPLDYTHRLNASSQLRDMYGFRAARKTELTGKGGGPVQMIDVTKLSNDQLVQLESILAAAAPAGDAEAGPGGTGAEDSAPAEPGEATASVDIPSNGR